MNPRAKKIKPDRKTRPRKDKAEPVEVVRDESAGPFVSEELEGEDDDELDDE